MGIRRDSLKSWSGRWLRACVAGLVLGLVCPEALAQEPTSTCTPAIGRLVSLQGIVELQRAGGRDWNPVKRLDTTICPGDRVRTGALSRAALFLQPETIVRVDQNTTITLRQSNEAIEVEFFAAELAAQAQSSQSRGAGYFITRFPKKFKVVTPHMNAAVEGTEFMVELSSAVTKLTVIEGKVSSESVATSDTQMVVAGQSIASGTSGPGAIVAVIKPQDAVQWVLRYPPLSDGPSTSTRAEELLRVGSVDAALAAIDETLVKDPGNADALALRAVIQIAKNDTVGALESATNAAVSGAGSYRSWLALSYAQQASFDLDAALGSAVKAESLQSGSSLAHARVAELDLSLGNTRRAEEAARAAISSNPAESHAHCILGFVHLANIDANAARVEFETAIERDSFSPLPRLGLGLAKIREGELVEGREQIEIAVALDPSNSLLRSYVGKAYYEENTHSRDGLAATQFELARALDPNDPTTWFYEGILKDSQSRPAAALKLLEQSSELNGDRAVYRSRQLLDQDLAARGASQASVYNELGFHQIGLLQAARSLAIDPGSSSAHRFLADINATLPRYSIARASELLQSQLRQPLGAPPLQAQLANDVLFRNTFFGAETVGMNEFNPLFIRDGLRTQVFGLAGNDDAWGDQVILSGLNGPFSFGISQFAADSDGFRENNDDSIRQYDGFLQWQAAADTSLQLEITDWSRESGELDSAFDPGILSPDDRHFTDIETQRLGARHVLSSRSDVLVSVIHQDRHASLRIPIPEPASSIVSDDESWKAEAQYLTEVGSATLVFGASYFDADSLLLFNFPPDSFPNPFTTEHYNAYGYAYFAPSARSWQLQVGVSYDRLSSEVGDQSEVNPKFGVIWEVSDFVTLRAAAFRNLKRNVNSDQGLEATQIAGFNQVFDDFNATISESGGVAADFRFSPGVAAGIEARRRNLETPVFDDQSGGITIRDAREDVLSAYFNWLVEDRVALSVEARHHEFEHGPSFDSMRLTELPISMKFMAPSGLWAGITVTGVEQSGEFDSLDGTGETGSDRFWLTNAIVAYRFDRRRGTISLEGTNLFGEEFRFQEIDNGTQPRYVPEAQYFLRIALSF